MSDYNINNAEKQLVVAALTRAGNIVGAAQLLGITRNALKRRIVKHRIQWERRATETPAVTPESRMSRSASRTFSWLAMLAPHRVWSEEVGDALEMIAKMETLGCSPWQIRLKVWSTIFWVLLNGVRELIAGLTGRKSPHK